MKKAKGESKVGVVQKEFKAGKLHSGSKHGPLVKSKAQAIAIGLSEARAAGEHVSPDPSKKHHSPDPWSSQGHTGLTQAMGGRFEPHNDWRPHVEPAKLGPYPAPSTHAAGFVTHGAPERRQGHLRMSGHPGAHRIGKR